MRDKFPRGCIEADPSLTSEQDAPLLLSQPRHIVADYYRTRGVAREKVSAGGESSDGWWRFIGRCIGRFEK